MSRTPCNCRICRERRELTAAAMTAPYGSLPSPVYPVLVEYVGGTNAGSLRYLDSEGRLWLDHSCTGQRMNSGFKPTATRGQYRNSDRDLVRECAPVGTKAEPEKRYAVQMGDGSGSGPGNSLSLHRTETTARAVARAKAEAHPGKKVLLLAVTEVETCLVTIQTKAVKSWE